MNSKGSCLCGAVTFQAENVDNHVHGCHCTICQKWNGGPVLAANVDSVTFNTDSNISRYSSSDWAERGFCKTCGAHLFYYLKDQDRYLMWIGAFDDTTPFKLSGEIFIDEKPGYYDFAGDHERLTGAQFMAAMQQSSD